MILGAISFAGPVDGLDLKSNIIRWNISGDISYHPRPGKEYNIGFFLNRKLPYTETDCFFIDRDQGIIILISGTIYNRPELNRIFNLQAGQSNPEIIAKLFREKGPGFVRWLNGDFTILVLLQPEKRAFLYRDHVGIRPIAWTLINHSIIFSSDINGLSRSLCLSKPVDTDFLTGHFRFIDYRKTPCREVRKLLPGHYLIFSENGPEMIKYWNPEEIATDGRLKFENMISELGRISYNSVRERCDSRFIAGAHVSGGLDSGFVASVARKEYHTQARFNGFSWSPANFIPGDIKYDERELVLAFCDKTGIVPVFSELDREEFSTCLSSYYLNSGFFSEESTLKQASGRGVNLIFSGWGGDEFISTGDRGIETDLLRGLHLRTFINRSRIRNPRLFIRDILNYVILPLLGIPDRSTTRSFRDDAYYLKKEFKKSDKTAIRKFYGHHSRRQLHLRMLEFYHLQNRCEAWYIMGFRKGVEYRFPLLDRKIIEYMLQVPSVLICQAGHFRHLLREIGKEDLPDEVRNQFDKSDPVYWRYIRELYRDSALRISNEIDAWESNPDLHFTDFSLLKKDIRMFKENLSGVEGKILFRTIIYLKAIHEFTTLYHRKQSDQADAQ